ncbi:hypothetical protein [Nonomuraea candida]|uniref:hypothetical protein n=1 Tax=Nonomuraea candida TaxID=359159 RepID=UPI0005B94BC6|nr:hypothetical protein [Nonomuraea candida]
MFFESAQTEETPPAPMPPELPHWLGPPLAERGVILPVELTLGRSDHVALHLPFVRAYTTGCAFEAELALRQGGLTPTDFLDLHVMALYNPPQFRSRAGEPLPDRLLRWGVRFRDGTKLTTLDRRDRGAEGPLLAAMSEGQGRTASLHAGVRLWLWPLPPPEPFELAVEWPLAGIALTFTELDGAAIAAAGARSAAYWP